MALEYNVNRYGEKRATALAKEDMEFTPESLAELKAFCSFLNRYCPCGSRPNYNVLDLGHLSKSDAAQVNASLVKDACRTIGIQALKRVNLGHCFSGQGNLGKMNHLAEVQISNILEGGTQIGSNPYNGVQNSLGNGTLTPSQTLEYNTIARKLDVGKCGCLRKLACCSG